MNTARNIFARFIASGTRRMCVHGLAMAGLLLIASAALGQGYGMGAQTPGNPGGVIPRELLDAGISEKLGAKIPLDLTFTDSDGRSVTLEDYIRGSGGRPVVLNLVYYECPMLCTFALNGTLDTLKQMDASGGWTPGGKFDVLTVSFKPGESHAMAAEKKANYLAALGRPEAASGWHFLVGQEPAIKKLTDAVGFGYRWVEAQGQYAHSSAMIILTPDGRVHRYLHGFQYLPQTVRLSLVEASAGKIGSMSDKAQLMFCFQYDPTLGAYGPAAMKIMRGGGLLTVSALALVIAWLFHRERNRKTAAPNAQAHAA